MILKRRENDRGKLKTVLDVEEVRRLGGFFGMTSGAGGWRVAGVPATKHGVEPDGNGARAWMSAPAWAPGYLPVLALALRRIEDMARTT